MMASITPLGERARGNRWGRTAAAFTAGSVLGGWGLGSAAGAAGLLVAVAGVEPAGAATLVAAGLALAAGVAELAGWPLPTRRRQVDDRWLGRYRGWVYGAGYGVQLGAGLATTVTTAALYAAVGLAVVLGAGGRPGWASVAGAAFGLVRAVPVLAGGRLRSPAALRHRLARAAAMGRAGRLASGWSLCALAVLAVAGR